MLNIFLTIVHLLTPERPHLLEDELHAEPQLLLCVDLKLFELLHQDVELLRAKFVQDAASLSRQCCHVVLQ